MNPKITIIIKVICILVLISLLIGIYFNAKNISCDKCVINFKLSRKLGVNVNWNQSIKVLDLAGNFSNGNCLVTWDDRNGYISKVNSYDYPLP